MVAAAAFALLAGGLFGPDDDLRDPQGLPLPWNDSRLSGSLTALEVLPNSLQEEGRHDSGLSLGVAAHGRYSIPFGTADHHSVVYGGVVFVSDHVSWSDLFDPGWGFDIELDLFFSNLAPPPPKGTPPSRAGVAVLFERDEFNGDNLGSVDVGNLTMTNLLVGAVAQSALGPGLYTKGHIAVGAVHYSAVHATFSGPGFIQTRDELLEDTWTIGGDLRAAVGLMAGPFGISFGIGLRIQAPPSEGTRVTLHSGAFWTFDLNLGVDIGF